MVCRNIIRPVHYVFLTVGVRPSTVVTALAIVFLMLGGTAVHGRSVNTLVYDGFNYKTGEDLKQKDGGFGWNDPWQKNNKRMEVVENSLSYTDQQGNSLVTTGNRVERIVGNGGPNDSLDNDSKYERTYDPSLGHGGQAFDPDAAPKNDPDRDEIWGSILIQGANGGKTGLESFEGSFNGNKNKFNRRQVFEREADGDIAFGQGINSEQNQYEASAQSSGIKTSGVQPNGLLGTDPEKTAADLLVVNLDFDTSGNSETFKYWMNPHDLTAPTLNGPNDAEGFFRLNNVSDGDPQQLDLFADINGAAFDEIRKGESFSDVTPVPVPGTGALGLVGLALAGFIVGRRSVSVP